MLRPEFAANVGREMANQAGKRYQCGTCGSEMMVTRSGQGNLTCCDKPMHLKA